MGGRSDVRGRRITFWAHDGHSNLSTSRASSKLLGHYRVTPLRENESCPNRASESGTEKMRNIRSPDD